MKKLKFPSTISSSMRDPNPRKFIHIPRVYWKELPRNPHIMVTVEGIEN